MKDLANYLNLDLSDLFLRIMQARGCKDPSYLDLNALSSRGRGLVELCIDYFGIKNSSMAKSIILSGGCKINNEAVLD